VKPNQLLKGERERRGWTQARVAELVGTDIGSVSRWERGVASPSPHFREKLCALYGKDAQDLGFLAGDSDRPPDTDSTVEAVARVELGEPSRALEPAPYASKSTRQPAPAPPAAPARASRVLACLAYALGWLTGLLVALFSHSDRFVLFHSLQSLLFFGAANLIVVVCAPAVTRGEQVTLLNGFLALVGSLTAIVAAVVWVLGILHAARGRYYYAPIVGRFCLRVANALSPATQPD
jgi:uncharacterized membrane protein/DNA-binding XRE family transcriptional regulator